MASWEAPKAPVHNKPENLRLYTVEALGCALLDNSTALKSLFLQRDAHALASKWFERCDGEGERAATHADAHFTCTCEIAEREKFALRIQAELHWRQDNPDFDPEDPFNGE